MCLKIHLWKFTIVYKKTFMEYVCVRVHRFIYRMQTFHLIDKCWTRLVSRHWSITLQDRTVWILSSQNHCSYMNLCRANQYQYASHKVMAMCYLEKKLLFLKQHWSIKPKQLNVINIHKTRLKHTLSHFCVIFCWQLTLSMSNRVCTLS